MASQPQKEARWIVQTQLIFLGVIFLMARLFTTSDFSLGVLAGGLVAWVPTCLFYRVAFSHFGAQKVRRIVSAFYWGEALKFATTVIGFAVVFVWLRVDTLGVCIGFVGVQAALWLSPLWFKVKKRPLKRD